MSVNFEQCYSYIEEAEMYLTNAKKEIEEYEKYIEEYDDADEIFPDEVDVSNKVKEQIEFCVMYNDLAKENLL